ncbi:MAG: sugar phosphate isomerase/epimerase [Gemmatimonadota bacterium]
MEGPPITTRRRFLAGLLGTAGVGAVSGQLWGEAAGSGVPTPAATRLPAERIGVQLYTVRDLLPADRLGLEGTLELLSDVGITGIELAGDFLGHTPGALRALAAQHGIQIVGNHFGPRTMDGANPWYDEAGRSQIFAEATELGLEYVGTGHYYNVPLTSDGFRAFAATLNAWGAAASAAGLKFYFHNHDAEFTRVAGRPLFEILLEDTDPDLVAFELDLGWTAIAGEDVYGIVRQHQHRFPYFHVKDFRFDADGPRETKPNTLAAGRRFTFTDVGKGQIDWARLFTTLDDPTQHRYLIERDDAGNDRAAEGRPPTNPAGSANTVWVSHRFLTELDF